MTITLSNNILAQSLHVALGALAVFGLVAMNCPHGQLIGSIAMIVFAAIKEGWFDPKYEDAATRGNGWVDFAFYIVGIGFANLLLLTVYW